MTRKLGFPERTFVIDSLALGARSDKIVDDVRQQYGITISVDAVNYYRARHRKTIMERQRLIEKQVSERFPVNAFITRLEFLDKLLQRIDRLGRGARDNGGQEPIKSVRIRLDIVNSVRQELGQLTSIR